MKQTTTRVTKNYMSTVLAKNRNFYKRNVVRNCLEQHSQIKTYPGFFELLRDLSKLHFSQLLDETCEQVIVIDSGVHRVQTNFDQKEHMAALQRNEITSSDKHIRA